VTGRGKKGGQSRRDAIQGVTQAAYARGRGISRQAIRKAIESGRLSVLKGGRIDPRKADRALRDNTDPSKLRGKHVRRAYGPGAGGGTPRLYDSKARRELALAQLAELELEERRGQLVPEAKVREQAFRHARETRDQMLAIVDRLAPELVNQPEEGIVRQMLADGIRRALVLRAGDDPEPPAPPVVTLEQEAEPPEASGAEAPA